MKIVPSWLLQVGAMSDQANIFHSLCPSVLENVWKSLDSHRSEPGHVSRSEVLTWDLEEVKGQRLIWLEVSMRNYTARPTGLSNERWVLPLWYWAVVLIKINFNTSGCFLYESQKELLQHQKRCSKPTSKGRVLIFNKNSINLNRSKCVCVGGCTCVLKTGRK